MMFKFNEGDLVYVTSLPKEFSEWEPGYPIWANEIKELLANKTIMKVTAVMPGVRGYTWCTLEDSEILDIPDICLAHVYTV